MKELKELLKLEIFSYGPERMDKDKRPADFVCPLCGNDKVGWFWLEGECPDILPSHWERHLCRCMILQFLRGRRAYMNYGLNEMTDKQLAAVNSKKKLLNDVIRALEECRDNIDYYSRRYEMADDLSSFRENGDLVWLWLFDCNKEETEYYLKVIALEQPNAK